MRPTKLILINAKRLMVRGIKRFEVDFNSLYQIILGTNGSGKSTILSEMSPLPATPKMYAKGGRKEFHCDHDGSQFIMINDFAVAGGKHSFIKDGVDLNENGTAAIQKELVRKYFNGLTPELFNVLTFRKFHRFTEMDTNKRRQWMMQLSGIDLDWAMDVYQALRVRGRDASGHVKRINQKLATETQYLVEDEDVIKMEERLKTIQSDFTEALRLTKNGLPSSNDIERLLEPKLFQLNALNADLDRFMAKLENGICTFGLTNKEGLERYLASLTATIDVTEDSLSKAYQDKMTVDGELNKLKELGAAGLSEYEDVINKLQDELKATSNAINQSGFGPEFGTDKILGMKANVEGLVKHTTNVLTSMFDNSNELITFEKTNDYRNREHTLLVNATNLRTNIDRLKHRMQHSKETHDVTCPKCTFVFKPGFHVSFEEEAPKLLAKMEQELVDNEKQMKEVNEYLAQVLEYSNGLKQYEQLTIMYSGYDVLWRELGNFGLQTSNPKIALNILNRFVEWIDLLVHYLEISKVLEDKNKVYEQAKQIDSKDMESTKKQASDLENLIEENITKLDDLRKKKQGLTELAKVIGEIEEGVRVSEMLVNEVNEILEQEDDVTANSLLEDVLRTLQGEIESLERQVSTIRVQRAIVEDLKQTFEQAKFEQDLYKYMADELSPTDGLIADILRKFIESFTTNQTNIISSIWSYPLAVLPCISNKDGLDYKFPIRVYGSSLPIPDISEGSDAQVDVIDFSFVAMVMHLLKLHDFPLYLDEPISRMDEIHRIEMIRIIQSMVESNQCSMMFFISHFAAQHGSFADSETLVMDSSNIVNLPTIFNKHCVIK